MLIERWYYYSVFIVRDCRFVWTFNRSIDQTLFLPSPPPPPQDYPSMVSVTGFTLTCLLLCFAMGRQSINPSHGWLSRHWNAMCCLHAIQLQWQRNACGTSRNNCTRRMWMSIIHGITPTKVVYRHCFFCALVAASLDWGGGGGRNEPAINCPELISEILLVQEKRNAGWSKWDHY